MFPGIWALCPKQQKNNDRNANLPCVSEITMLIKRIQNQTGYFFKKNFPASHQAAVKYPVLKCLAMLFYSV